MGCARSCRCGDAHWLLFRAAPTADGLMPCNKYGRLWYEKHCTPCHGPGRAPGSATSRHSQEPPDLSTAPGRVVRGTTPAIGAVGVVIGQCAQTEEIQ